MGLDISTYWTQSAVCGLLQRRSLSTLFMKKTMTNSSPIILQNNATWPLLAPLSWWMYRLNLHSLNKLNILTKLSILCQITGIFNFWPSHFKPKFTWNWKIVSLYMKYVVISLPEFASVILCWLRCQITVKITSEDFNNL